MQRRLTRKARARVAGATVRLTKLGGQGVLVPGGFFLTAAHCIEWECEGGMAMDAAVEPLLTAGGTQLLAQVAAVEPVSDVAALGEPDNQHWSEEWYAYLEHVEAVEPVPLFAGEMQVEVPVPVHVLTHVGGWVSGEATLYGLPDSEPGPRVWVSFDEQIKGGTSGGPVVNDAGELLGLISFSSETGGPCDGMVPVPRHALPAWLVSKILAAQVGALGVESGVAAPPKSKNRGRRAPAPKQA